MKVEILYGIGLTTVLAVLGPLAAIYVKKRRYDVAKSFRVFVSLTVIRLSAVGIFSFFLFKNGGNLFLFLITFATVYSLLLIPEVLLIARALKERVNDSGD